MNASEGPEDVRSAARHTDRQRWRDGSKARWLGVLMMGLVASCGSAAPSPRSTGVAVAPAEAAAETSVSFDAEGARLLIDWAQSDEVEFPDNWQDQEVFALTRRWAELGGLEDPDPGIERLLVSIAKANPQSPIRARITTAAELLEQCMRRKDEVLGAGLQRVRAYLPPGTAMEATVLFGMFVPAYAFTLDDRIVINVSADFWGGEPSKVLNLLVHELYHVGFAVHTTDEPLAADPSAEQVRQHLRWYVHNEGMATWVGYQARPQDLRVEDYAMLEDPAIVSEHFATLNELWRSAAADHAEPDTVRSQIWELGVARRSFYVVGAAMARRIEEHSGRAALIATVEDGPSAFFEAYARTDPPADRTLRGTADD